MWSMLQEKQGTCGKVVYGEIRYPKNRKQPQGIIASLMLLIPLDAAGSDLPSLPALFLPTVNCGGGSDKVRRVPKTFSYYS